ncbi:MBL fold metallo-hydrolase [Paenibacillus sp. FSL R10-2734]|uniref:MBL fold metallo-hydrolase n=1 Tax=Paenibacillus sp. FSL R10-2734 TaxID=2954691 RepID=UPI0030D91B6D
MKRIIVSIFMSLVLLLMPVLAEAHPGRTDGDGGHYCRTNCAKWGLEDGEYHYHNGGSSDSKPTATAKPAVKPTAKPTPKPTATPAPTLLLPKKQNVGTLQVYFFDVGQGDSTLIRTPNNQYVLIDGGDNTQGKNVVKYLNALGVKTLDAMVATHPDADHIGGLDDVLKAVDVKSVYAPKVSHTTDTYKDFLTAVKNEGRTIKSVTKGGTIPLSGIEANFLAPINTYGDDLNNWSAVLKITYKNNSFLFTGDAELKSENDMLADGLALKADVLKVGHHGSNSSTSKAFLNAVKPQYSLISVGKNNYGHPDSGILTRLKNADTSILRTDQKGTITAISDGSKISFTTTKGASK